VGVLVGVERVNGGDEGEGIRLMGFILNIRNRTMKPPDCFKWGREGVSRVDGGGDQTM
jgi:hypothetical protein